MLSPRWSRSLVRPERERARGVALQRDGGGIGGMVATSARSLRARTEIPTRLRLGVVAGGALTALAAAGCIVWLAQVSDHVRQPEVQAALMIWVVLLYVVAGLVACWLRRGRFGPLMVAAGFAMFLSTVSWANAPGAFTFGIVFDLLPAVL